MGGVDGFWHDGDALSHAVALALLAMSLASWFVILWKSMLLAEARRGHAVDGVAMRADQMQCFTHGGFLRKASLLSEMGTPPRGCKAWVDTVIRVKP